LIIRTFRGLIEQHFQWAKWLTAVRRKKHTPAKNYPNFAFQLFYTEIIDGGY